MRLHSLRDAFITACNALRTTHNSRRLENCVGANAASGGVVYIAPGVIISERLQGRERGRWEGGMNTAHERQVCSALAYKTRCGAHAQQPEGFLQHHPATDTTTTAHVLRIVAACVCSYRRVSRHATHIRHSAQQRIRRHAGVANGNQTFHTNTRLACM